MTKAPCSMQILKTTLIKKIITIPAFSFIACTMVLVMTSCKQNYEVHEITDEEIREDTLNSTIEDVDSSELNAGRTLWQKPDAVIGKLGDLSQKTVADIGAGTGYFSFRLALQAKKVIAVDIDSAALRTIQSFVPKLPLKYRNRLETRHALPDNPNLAPGETDVVVIINTAAYIPQLSNYLKTLKKGLKKGGILMIVDYKMKKLFIPAPPKSERIYLDVVEDMLEEAGYISIQSDDTTLDYQYIIKAINPE